MFNVVFLWLKNNQQFEIIYKLTIHKYSLPKQIIL